MRGCGRVPVLCVDNNPVGHGQGVRGALGHPHRARHGFVLQIYCLKHAEGELFVFEIEARVKSSDHFIETGQVKQTFIHRRCTMDDAAQLLKMVVFGTVASRLLQSYLQQLIIFLQDTWSTHVTPGNLQQLIIFTLTASAVSTTLSEL